MVIATGFVSSKDKRVVFLASALLLKRGLDTCRLSVLGSILQIGEIA